MDTVPFPGSYNPEDAGFLLRRMNLTPVALPEREQLMQSGARHYSEMIGPEDRPSRERVAIFRACLEHNAGRFARDLCALADALFASAADLREITVASIARAGTPVGVLLVRILRRRATAAGWAADAVRHYSLSIIRDRGLDVNAVRWITARHPAGSIRFVDGWTGKGTIARELAQSIADDPALRAHANLPGLWAPLDICGAACWSASEDDYVIPSSLLGGTISGLVSRSVLPRERIGSTDFHGCVELPHLRRYDLTRWFVERLDALCRTIAPDDAWVAAHPANPAVRGERLAFTQDYIEGLRAEYGISDPHRVKIGIGESVRVALRRQPERILLRKYDGPDARIILRLAALRAIPIEQRSDLPFAAVAIIARAA